MTIAAAPEKNPPASGTAPDFPGDDLDFLTTEELQQQALDAERELHDFRTTIRQVAIKGLDDGYLDHESLSHLFDELGLGDYAPRYQRRWRGDFRFSFNVDDAPESLLAAAALNSDRVREALRAAVATVITEHIAPNVAVDGLVTHYWDLWDDGRHRVD